MKPGWRMFGDAVAHDHPDTTVLHVGCAGCMARADGVNPETMASYHDVPSTRDIDFDKLLDMLGRHLR